MLFLWPHKYILLITSHLLLTVWFGCCSCFGWTLRTKRQAREKIFGLYQDVTVPGSTLTQCGHLSILGTVLETHEHPSNVTLKALTLVVWVNSSKKHLKSIVSSFSWIDCWLAWPRITSEDLGPLNHCLRYRLTNFVLYNLDMAHPLSVRVHSAFTDNYEFYYCIELYGLTRWGMFFFFQFKS